MLAVYFSVAFRLLVLACICIRPSLFGQNVVSNRLHPNLCIVYLYHLKIYRMYARFPKWFNTPANLVVWLLDS